jgi:hypothetical protein
LSSAFNRHFLQEGLLYELGLYLPSDLVGNLKLTYLRPFAGSRYLEEHIWGTTAFDPLVGLVSSKCVELPVFVPLVGLDGSITTSCQDLVDDLSVQLLNSH